MAKSVFREVTFVSNLKTFFQGVLEISQEWDDPKTLFCKGRIYGRATVVAHKRSLPNNVAGESILTVQK